MLLALVTNALILAGVLARKVLHHSKPVVTGVAEMVQSSAKRAMRR